jgi:hypothetical protein
LQLWAYDGELRNELGGRCRFREVASLFFERRVTFREWQKWGSWG